MAINRMIHQQYADRWSIAEDADLLSVNETYSGFPGAEFYQGLVVSDAADSFDGHWQTSFHNIITPEIAKTNPSVGLIQGKVTEWSEPPGYRVIFTDNHDKSGSLNNSTRLANRMAPSDPSGKTARKKTLLNAALTLTAPGTPMLWMGQEFHATGPFSDAVRMAWREASAQHRIFRAHRDLINLRELLPALQNSDLNASTGFINDELDLMAYWRLGATNEENLVVLFNFSNQNRTIGCPFPTTGLWHVQFNSDWGVYGSDFGNVGPTDNTVMANFVEGGSSVQANVPVAALSMVVLARTAAPSARLIEDANGNGLADGWEAMFGVASSSADDDSDGLPNSYEVQNGLDPLEKDIATVALDGVTNSLRAESNNPNVQFVFWATKATANLRFPTYTFLSNTIAGTTFTNPAGGYLRLSLNLTNLASNSATFFMPNTNTSVINTDRTNWARSYGVTNFSENPDGDAFSNLQEFARGSDPYTSNRAGIYLAGQDNDWNVSNRPMTFLGDRVWVCDFPAPKNASREFKLTDGRDWANGVSWGDDQPDGLADQGSSRNISINFTRGGISRFQVDEGTMAYQVTDDATDVNGDGIQDAWVAFYGLTGPTAFSSADMDGDGWANLIEMNRGTSPQVANPKRMSVVGEGALPVALWNPAANNMIWNESRNQWEWVGTASASGNAVIKFAQGPNWSDPEWGTNVSGRIELRSPHNITNAVVAGTRYRIAFNDVALTYSVASFPISAEWWETNGLPAPLPTSPSDPRWAQDRDGDGNSQLMEYSLVGNPNLAETNRLISSGTTNSGGTNRLVLRWSQRTNATVQAEWHTNLSETGWSTSGLSINNIGSVANGTQAKEASVPIDSTNRKFLRLRVTGP